MTSATDREAREAAETFLADLVRDLDRQLGPALLGAHAIGSLAHDGFNRRYSDVDLALVVKGGLDQGQLDGIKSRAAGISPKWGPKLSIFWTNEGFSKGRLPPLDRLDLIEHGVALLERAPIRPPHPDLTEIRAYLSGAPIATWEATASRFAVMPSLDPKDRKAYLRAHLYPARFILSWQTARIASNDEAVAYLHDAAPAGLDVALIEDALLIRQAAADPDSLFERRTALRAQVSACRAMMVAAR